MKGPNHKGRILRDPRNSVGITPLTSSEIGMSGNGLNGNNYGGNRGNGSMITVTSNGNSVNHFSKGDNQLPQLLPHAPMAGKRRSSMDPTITENSSQKHVHELELENLKLKSRLQEAELSIMNYKGFLSAKSSLSNQNISTQTDNYDEISKESSVEIERLTLEVTQLRNENSILRNQVNSLIENQTNHVKISQEYETRIKELETTLQTTRAKKPRTKKISKIPPQETKVNHKELIVAELNDFNNLLSLNLETIRHRISLMDNPSPKKKLSTPIKIPPIDHACGPMTPTVIDRGHDPPTPSYKSSGWNISPISPKSKIDTCTVATNTDSLNDRDEYDRLSHQLQLQTILTQSLSDRLLTASQSVHGVVNKFSNEINAIKHWAHCKELVRIASLRELGLEKDRLLNELKYSRYSIIIFHLSYDIIGIFKVLYCLA